MNTTVNVRGLSEAEYQAAAAHADAAGKSLEGWMRQLVRGAIAAPIVRSRYAYKALEPGKATVKRMSDHPNGTMVVGAGWSQEQARVMERVKLLVIRNEAGDREEAIGLMQSVFELVVEVGL